MQVSNMQSDNNSLLNIVDMSPHFHWQKSFTTNLYASFTDKNDKNGAMANTK